MSPAGTAASQWISPAPPGALLGLVEGEEAEDGFALAADVGFGCAVGRGETVLEEGEIEHADSASAIAIATGLVRTP
ncbi:MAG: hypothetical protein NVS1B3_07520 [Candidatus Dormibacteraceae bacterium]